MQKTGDQWSPLRNCGNSAHTVGRGLAPAVRVDRYRKAQAHSVRDSEPALRRDECECGALVGRKAVPKPEGFRGVGALAELVVSRIQNPLCAGLGCECGALAGRKASPKPRALEGFESGTTANAPKKKDGFCRPFSLVHLQGFEPGTH